MKTFLKRLSDAVKSLIKNPTVYKEQSNAVNGLTKRFANQIKYAHPK